MLLYNFLMQGIKQFICGGCFAKFGCMTDLHYCPHCSKITCSNKKCDKEFGFMTFKVSERRETEIWKEVKE